MTTLMGISRDVIGGIAASRVLSTVLLKLEPVVRSA